ncbi:unnamed protein product [Caenorhabditis bovis]|uniref:Uncharacterized protein n=1 Tax=Caenorhabditis bovis TaxID=2654633 RepID=A0A8S1FCW8_9PELO|nr:unnamed protein product [Caenorhabditis bovis]
MYAQRIAITSSSMLSIQPVINKDLVSLSNILDTNTSDLKSYAQEWLKTDFDGEIIQMRTRSCLNMDFGHLNGSKKSNLTKILSPLRFLIIFMIGSAALALIDLTIQILISRSSFVRVVIHSLTQFIIWTYILIDMEMFRNSWVDIWPKEHVPAYPLRWLYFELCALLLIITTLFDLLTHNYADYSLRIEQSQGVYKCIELKEQSRLNETFRSLD